MTVEEPSVIAAVSGAAKLVASSGGFITTACLRNIIYAQIQLLDIPDSRVESVLERVGFYWLSARLHNSYPSPFPLD